MQMVTATLQLGQTQPRVELVIEEEVLEVTLRELNPCPCDGMPQVREQVGTVSAAAAASEPPPNSTSFYL